MMRFIPPAYASFILLITLLALCIGDTTVFGDPDTAWHLAAGKLMVISHSLPRFDPWSFTATGERWYNLSWLFDITISLLFAWGGFTALYTLTLSILALSIVYMAHHCVRRGASLLSVLLLLLPVILVVNIGALTRPNLCSIALALAFYHVLHRYRDFGRLKDMLVLPPLMIVWVNLHGGYLLAFPIMGLFFIEAAFNENREYMRNYGLIIALCLAATLINPYGFEVYYGAYKTLAGTFDKTRILEWRPVEIGHQIPMTLFLLIILCIGNGFDRRIALVDRILAIMLFILSLSSGRYAVIAGLLMMPYMSLRITALLHESRFGARLARTNLTILNDMQKNDVRILAAVMAALAFLLISTPFPRDRFLSEPLGFPAKQFPVKEAAYVLEHYPHMRFFNDYNIGGYLDYLWHGEEKVFVDGRASSLYSEALLKDYTDFIDSHGYGGRARMIATHYHLDGLIIPHVGTEAALWHWNPDWKAVYSGDVATVYVRRPPE